MNSKIAVTILLLILSLSVLTILMIVVNKGADNMVMQKIDNINSTKNKKSEVKEKTRLENEIENKNYNLYTNPELEKQKDEAKLRLEKLDILRGGSQGPTEEDIAKMSAEEKAQLEVEAQKRLDRLNELRAGDIIEN